MSAAAAAALKSAKPSKKTLAATAALEAEELAAAEAATKLAEEEAIKALPQEPTKRTFLVEAELDTVLELPALPSDLRALVSYIKNMLALVEEDSISKGYLLVCVRGEESGLADLFPSKCLDAMRDSPRIIPEEGTWYAVNCM